MVPGAVRNHLLARGPAGAEHTPLGVKEEEEIASTWPSGFPGLCNGLRRGRPLNQANLISVVHTALLGVGAMEGFRLIRFIVLAAPMLLGAWGLDAMNGTLFRYGTARMSAAFMTGAALTLLPLADPRSLLPRTNRGRKCLRQGLSQPTRGTL